MTNKADEAKKDKPLERELPKSDQGEGSAQVQNAESAAGNENRGEKVSQHDGEKTGQESGKDQWAPTGPVRDRPPFGGPVKAPATGGTSGGQQSQAGDNMGEASGQTQGLYF